MTLLFSAFLTLLFLCFQWCLSSNNKTFNVQNWYFTPNLSWVYSFLKRPNTSVANTKCQLSKIRSKGYVRFLQSIVRDLTISNFVST